MMLLTFYHRYRIKRIFLGEGEAVGDRGELDLTSSHRSFAGDSRASQLGFSVSPARI